MSKSVIQDLGSRSLGLNVHQNFKHLLLRNHRANSSQILYRMSVPHGNMTKMVGMPIYGKKH